jgi:uncharacterized protein (DUF302 family)
MVVKSFLLILAFTLSVNANSLTVKKSKYSVLKTVCSIRSAIKNKSLHIFKIINHQKGAKKVGLKMQESIIILFGNPKLGTKLMQLDPLIAYELPMKILVTKNKNNQTIVSYKDGTWLKNNYNLGNSPLPNKINKVLASITNAAIK